MFGFTGPQTGKDLAGGSVDRSILTNRICSGCLPDKYVGRRLNREETNVQEMKCVRRKQIWIQDL